MAPVILLEHQEAISTLTLNRPKAFNAINSQLAAEFLVAVKEVAARKQTRVLIIQGHEKAFMAGGDVPQFREAPDSVVPELIEPMNQAIELLHSLPIPVIASVSGAIAGAGISLMLACDLTLASTNSKINFAYVKLGASCDLGISWHLPRIVGLRKALEIALLSEPMDAQQAWRLNLLNQLIEPEQLVEKTQALAQQLASSAPIALAQLKALMRTSLDHTLPQQLAAEKNAFAQCMASEDFRQGVAGFLDKRAVVFNGV